MVSSARLAMPINCFRCASTGSGRRCSNAVATQVANAMTKWEEHLLYRSDRKADRP